MPAKRTVVVLVVVLALAAGAGAWHRHGHVLASRAAVGLVSGRVPAFFVASVETIAHVSQDNDAFSAPSPPRSFTRPNRLSTSSTSSCWAVSPSRPRATPSSTSAPRTT